jgi:PAS domain S-box-containing protein
MSSEPAITATEQELRRHLLRTFVSRTPFNSGVGALTALVATLLLLLYVPVLQVAAWLSVHACLHAFALYKFLSARRGGKAGARRSVAGAESLLAIWAACFGVAWGSIAFFIPSVPVAAGYAILLVVGVFMAGTATYMAPVPRVALAFLFGAGLPIASVMLTRGTTDSMVLAGLLGVELLGLSIGTQFVHGGFRTQILSELRVRAELQMVAAERRLAEDLLAERSSQYQWLLDNTDEIIFQLDDQGRITFANAVGRRVLGYDAAAAASRTIMEIVTPDAKERVASILQGALRDAAEQEEPETLAIEVPITANDGRVLIFDVRARVSRSFQGETRIACTARNVTRQREMESALRESTAILRSTLESLPDGVVVANHRGAIIAANELFFSILGSTKEAIEAQPNHLWAIGARMKQMEVPDASWPDRKRTTMLVTRQPIHSTRQLTDGRWLELRTVPSTSKRTIGVLRDVSEQKERETQLFHARQAAEEASLAKSSFLAMMSHEIRTPMNGMLGMLEELSSVPLDTKGRRIVSLVRESGEALVRIVNDILDESRLSAGAVEVENSLFDLRALVSAVTDIARPQIRSKPVELEHEVAKDVPLALLSDRGRVRQVLLNLLNNAIKFTEAGQVKLRVFKATGEQGADVIRFQVDDTGIGMSVEAQARIFGAFTQADSSIARRFGGSGLGLSISQKLVVLLGGEMNFRSVPDAGSSFWFDLPSVQEQDMASPRSAPATRQIDLSGLRGRKALVAEDNEVNAEVAESMVRRLGLEVHRARNGCEAVEAVRNNDFSIIFMDVNMPVMGGLEAIREIRVMGPEMSATPVVALTANVFEEDVKACLDAGADLVLPKPIQFAQLQEAVAKLCLASELVAETPGPAGGTHGPATKDVISWTIFRQLTRVIGDKATISLAEKLVLAAQTAVKSVAQESATLDLEHMQRHMHSLKSSAAQFGALELSRIATRCETILSQGANRLPESDVRVLSDAVDALAAAVSELVVHGVPA